MHSMLYFALGASLAGAVALPQLQDADSQKASAITTITTMTVMTLFGSSMPTASSVAAFNSSALAANSSTLAFSGNASSAAVTTRSSFLASASSFASSANSSTLVGTARTGYSFPTNSSAAPYAPGSSVVRSSVIAANSSIATSYATSSVVPSSIVATSTSASASTPTADTAAAFLADASYDAIAAAAAVPSGYEVVFGPTDCATSQGGYMGYYLLNSFDTATCAAHCESASGCIAFNVYIERDPSVDPTSDNVNPSSVVNYKCSLWGEAISADTATNCGQWREEFQVVITGSMGYELDE